MRCRVSRFRSRLAGQSALFALVIAVSGCSSDWTRFDSSLYTSSADPAAAPASSYSSNPYPGDLDATTTASIGARPGVASPRPLGNVTPRPVLPDHDGYQPRPTASNRQYGASQPGYTTQQTYDRSASAYTPQQQPYQPAASRQPIERAPLPQPVSQPYQQPQAYQAPAPDTRLDRTITSSVNAGPTPVALPNRPLDPARVPASSAVQQPAVSTPSQAASAPAKRGWTAAGGTTVTLQHGETLFNLSKRYGVPVQELMRANDIADADHVRAGQRIVVPTYVYSRNAPVSAPDANGQTRFARASTGSLVQPDLARVPLPARKPVIHASAAPVRNALDTGFGVDRSLITGSVGQGNEPRATLEQPGSSAYTVVAGDTLTRIARRHGTTVRELMAANALDNSTIRIGQKLSIPGASTALAGSVDPQTTSGRPSRQLKEPEPRTAATDKPQVQSAEAIRGQRADDAPERTGIGTFRWPVRGRVIAKFGDRDGATKNDGIDISVPEGTAVKAAENGVVVYAGNELEGFGNLVLLRHGGGWITAYAHNKRLDVARGDVVRRGEIIARSGRTGDAKTPKLHFELRKNSTPVDPVKYLGS